jgi:SAM-dependent methyltransferase
MFRESFLSRDARLYYTVLRNLQKPFNPKMREHWGVYYKMIREIETMIKQDSDDQQVYNYIHNFLNSVFYPKFGYPNNESDGRADSRLDDISAIINELPELKSVLCYLDIGCSEGCITSRVGESFGLPVSKIFGVDVRIPKKVDGYTFLRLEGDNGILPFEDNSLDVVSYFMVLHHIPNPLKSIREVQRILKPGGYVIIREHDIDSTTDKNGKWFLDILHGLYSISWAKKGEQEDPEFCSNYFADYHSREYWTNMFLQNGFAHIDNTTELAYHYNTSRVNRLFAERSRIKNPYSFYYAVYQKL